MLTPAQLNTLKTDIANDGTLGSLPHNSDSAQTIAEAYNLLASPAFWVWRTSLSVKEIYESTASDGSTWSAAALIARSQGERDAWRDLTAGIAVLNPSLVPTRTNIADIFNGASGTGQRAYLLAVARRQATRAEKLFATGTGSTGSPATMTMQGTLSGSDVEQAWATA